MSYQIFEWTGIRSSVGDAYLLTGGVCVAADQQYAWSGVADEVVVFLIGRRSCSIAVGQCCTAAGRVGSSHWTTF